MTWQNQAFITDLVQIQLQFQQSEPATKKSASGTINIPLQNENTDSFADTFYLFAKGDAGTFTLDTAEFGWSE